MVALIAH